MEKIFKLSEKTRIEVKPSQFDTNQSYLKITRLDPAYGDKPAKERWINICEKVWYVFEKSVMDIVVAIQNKNEDATFRLSDREELQVTKFHENMYVSVISRVKAKDSDKIYQKRINLSVPEWDKLVSIYKKISVSMKGKSLKRKMQISDGSQSPARKIQCVVPSVPQMNEAEMDYLSFMQSWPEEPSDTLTQYSWQYENTDRKSMHWFFTRDACESDAKYSKPEDALAAPIIHTRIIPVPSAKHLLDMIACFLITERINELKSKKCYGCQVDHPSQIQHMYTGCMMEWEDAVRYYFDEAVKMTTPEKVTEAFLKIVNVLKVSHDVHGLFSEMNMENIKDMVKSQDMDIEFTVLFRDSIL